MSRYTKLYTYIYSVYASRAAYQSAPPLSIYFMVLQGAFPFLSLFLRLKLKGSSDFLSMVSSDIGLNHLVEYLIPK